MNIVVIGYPYTRPNYRAVFDSANVFFILPRAWEVKRGKAVYRTEAGPHVVTTAAPFSRSDYPIIGGLLKGWMPAFPLLLWRLKRQHGIRLVFEAHEPTLLTTLYHGTVTKLFGLKHIVFSWENIPFEQKLHGLKGMAHRLILRANLACADGVVCGNQKCMTIFRGLTSKPLVRIPLAGLDTERFHPSQHPLSHGDVRFLFAGAIDFRKGLHILLPAFRKLHTAMPNVHLTIVGSGTYERELDALLAEHPLPVTRFPWLDHDRLVALFSESDVFVYPSIPHAGWEEQFGYSMAEASLMQLPIIATHSGSIDEVVHDGETGMLVAPGNSDQLFGAMRQLAMDPELRRRLGRAGRSFITRAFSNGAVALRYWAFFGSISQ